MGTGTNGEVIADSHIVGTNLEVSVRSTAKCDKFMALSWMLLVKGNAEQTALRCKMRRFPPSHRKGNPVNEKPVSENSSSSRSKTMLESFGICQENV